jgi:hypothetical protein
LEVELERLGWLESNFEPASFYERCLRGSRKQKQSELISLDRAVAPVYWGPLW